MQSLNQKQLVAMKTMLQFIMQYVVEILYNVLCKKLDYKFLAKKSSADVSCKFLWHMT